MENLAFLDFLIDSGIFGEYTLKSGRKSPYMIDMAKFNDGKSLRQLGDAYARTILDSTLTFDCLYGIPEKGIPIAIATTISLGLWSYDASYFFTRKEPKGHGEGTKEKQRILGRAPREGGCILLLDDVLTTGGAKYESKADLDSLLVNPNYVGLVIAVDRQELDDEGKNAVEEFTKKTGIPVHVCATSLGIYLRACERSDVEKKHTDQFRDYLLAYGTQKVKDIVS